MSGSEEELPQAFLIFLQLAKIAKEKIQGGSKKEVDTAGTASTSAKNKDQPLAKKGGPIYE